MNQSESVGECGCEKNDRGDVSAFAPTLALSIVPRTGVEPVRV